MSVKRYEVYGDGGQTARYESPTGEYVLHSDYQSLAAENEGLRTVLHRIAYEPIGDAEDTDGQILDAITDTARQALSRKAAP